MSENPTESQKEIPCISLDVAGAALATAIPSRRIRQAIADGELRAYVYAGGAQRKKRVILPADLEIWIRTLPSVGEPVPGAAA